MRFKADEMFVVFVILLLEGGLLEVLFEDETDEDELESHYVDEEGLYLEMIH